MEKELGKGPSMIDVREQLLHHFAELFGYSTIEKSDFQTDETGCCAASHDSTIGTTGTF
jgi:hypothetical protein